METDTGPDLYCWNCQKSLRNKKGKRSGYWVGVYFCDRWWCRLWTWRWKKISLKVITKKGKE